MRIIGSVGEDGVVRSAGGSMGRSLVRLSVLVALVCLVVDSVSFLVQGPGSSHLFLLLVIISVDAALALPAKYSGWVALAHALAASRSP